MWGSGLGTQHPGWAPWRPETRWVSPTVGCSMVISRYTTMGLAKTQHRDFLTHSSSPFSFHLQICHPISCSTSSPAPGFLEDSGLHAALGVPGICVKSADVYFSHCNNRSSTPHLGIINNTNILSFHLIQGRKKKEERNKKDTDNLWIQDAVRVLAVAIMIA